MVQNAKLICRPGPILVEVIKELLGGSITLLICLFEDVIDGLAADVVLASSPLWPLVDCLGTLADLFLGTPRSLVLIHGQDKRGILGWDHHVDGADDEGHCQTKLDVDVHVLL